MGILSGLNKARKAAIHTKSYMDHTEDTFQYDIKRFLKWIIVSAIGAIGIFAFLACGVVIVMVVAITAANSEASIEDSDFSAFSKQVEEYRDYVNRQCVEQDMPGYANLILALMECETRGETQDPMNASLFASNTKYSKERKGIEDPQYSIQVAITEVKELLSVFDIKGYQDKEALKMLAQTYHYGREYGTFAKENGSYNSAQAKQYKDDNELPYYLSEFFAGRVDAFLTTACGMHTAYVYPLATYSVISGYQSAESPDGIRFKGGAGAEVFACGAGVVKEVSYDTSKGYTVKVGLNGTYQIVYQGLKSVRSELVVGASVNVGTMLGQLQTDNPVLYFKLYNQGKTMDPEILFSSNVGETAIDENPDVHNAIVNNALSYVGRISYVLGACDLNSAVDCSSFVMLIYRQYGIYLPRTTREQINYTADGAIVMNPDSIGVATLLPGDLLYYRGRYDGVWTEGVGHVAMYIGNGQIVHAANANVGIVISDWNYTTPLRAIRPIP